MIEQPFLYFVIVLGLVIVVGVMDKLWKRNRDVESLLDALQQHAPAGKQYVLKYSCVYMRNLVSLIDKPVSEMSIEELREIIGGNSLK